MESSGKLTPSLPDDDFKTAWEALGFPLQECGEIASLRLSSALSEALAQAEDQLVAEATQALTAREREDFLDAADLARVHRRSLAHGFIKHFERRYVRACQRRDDTLLGHFIDFDAKELRIVEHHVLDESLEPGLIAEAIQNASWKTLQVLASHFRELLHSQDLLTNDIPLSPKLIEAATADAIRDQPWRQRAKYRLVRALRWALAARVNLLYRDLVDHLNASDLRTAATRKENAHSEAQRSVPTTQPSPAESNGTVGSVPSGSTPPGPHGEDTLLAIAAATEPHAPDAELEKAESVAQLRGAPLANAPPAAAESEDQPRTPPQGGKPLPDTSLDGLAAGTWLKFSEPGKPARELKLAWISPRKSLYLLTNRQGERALSLKAKEFSRLMADGLVRVLSVAEEDPPKSDAEPKRPATKSA